MDPSGGFQLDFEELLLYLQLSLSISECNPCLTLTVRTGGFICLLNKVQNSLKKQTAPCSEPRPITTDMSTWLLEKHRWTALLYLYSTQANWPDWQSTWTFMLTQKKQVKNPTSSKWTSVISAPFAICQTAAVVSAEQMFKACPAYLVLLLCVLSNNMSCGHRSHSRIRFFEKCIRSDIQLLCLVFLPPQSELILVHFSGIWQMCTCNSTPLLQTLRAAWLIFRGFCVWSAHCYEYQISHRIMLRENKPK